MKEMKKNKIFLTMIFLTLFGILNCMNVKADGNFLLISDKDSYVNVDDPLTNYGLSQSLRLDTNYEIYLHSFLCFLKEKRIRSVGRISPSLHHLPSRCQR